MSTDVAERVPAPIDLARLKLTQMEPQFLRALPAHIPVERFTRVAMTAIQNNKDILACTEASVWNALMRAAQDGLLPDGRDGAIVAYDKEARWMPMIGGIRKKVRNSGEIKDWYVDIVYAGDEFDYQKGDDPHLHHKPVPPSQRLTLEGVPASTRLVNALGPFVAEEFDAKTKDAERLTAFNDVQLTVGDIRRAQAAFKPAPLPYFGIIAAYSIAVFKDGSKSVPEVMWIEEIEEVRKQSSKAKSEKTPWHIAAFYGEMCKKTVARRHSKTLPLSSDLDDLIRRDDDLYDFENAKQVQTERNGGTPQSLAGKLDMLAKVEGAPAMDPSATPQESQSAGEPEQAPAAVKSAPAASGVPHEDVAGAGPLLLSKQQLIEGLELLESKLGLLHWHEDPLVTASIEGLSDKDRRAFEKKHTEAEAKLPA